MSTWTHNCCWGRFGLVFFSSFFAGLRTRGWNKCLVFLSSFLFAVKWAEKNLNCFGKQSSDLTSALRIGWQEVAESSSMGLAMCLFGLF